MPRSIALALLSSALAQTLLDVLIAPESAPALSVALLSAHTSKPSCPRALNREEVRH